MAMVTSLSRRSLFNKLLTNGSRLSVSRLISTSKKNKEGHVTLTPEEMKPPIPDFTKPEQNKTWMSYGWSTTDRIEDRHRVNKSFFYLFTCTLVGGTFLMAYWPDMNDKEWANREAHLVLKERELAGLDPISPWYVDPDTVELPTDEELGDTEIIL